MKISPIKKESLMFICIACIPVVSAFLYCLINGGNVLWNIYLPDSQWNDEVFYYKQIEAIIEYGMPQGYFGYNESYAKYGTFGAWNPLLMVPYVIIGKILGWNYLSPVICNIIMMTIAFAVLSKLIKFDLKSAICLALAYFCIPGMVRYTISGMSESVRFTGIIIFFALFYNYYKFNKYRKTILITAAILTLITPYFLLMYILIVSVDIIGKQYKKIITDTILLILTSVSSLFITSKFCAAFFIPIIDNEFIIVFKEDGALGLVKWVICTFIEESRYLIAIMTNISWLTTVPCLYLIFFVLLVLVLIFVMQKTYELKLRFIGAATIVINIGMLLAIIFLYEINVGGRHIIPFIIINMLFIIMSTVRTREIMLIIIIVFSLVGKKESYISPPYRYDEITYEVEHRTEQFNEIFILNEDKWDNTVLWIISSNFRVCYSVPAGFGINIAMADYIEEGDLKAKWIIAEYDCESIVGYNQVFEDSGCKVFERIKE